MTALIQIYHSFAGRLNRAEWVLPTLARFLFAAVLTGYFWASAATKLGDGIFGFLSPSTGAYAQIFPKAFEAVGYDSGQLSLLHWAVVVAGTWAEFLLPVLIVLGLFTRLASLGMIGFIAVQSLTDLFGHGGIKHIETLGAWFDRMPDGVILDQRGFWILALVVLVVKGAGPLSLDRLLLRNAALVHPVSQPR
ncbi:DoxX [Thalassovita gelatinovora]|uniref:DoxX n=1 Tax=Thalassovita gelatinovora TaxID=53501 RepID=A0A0N7LVZ5_THAGE|nr:DoxX family protein [Thalassovita gelatinovora]QIZ82113.1 DoxX family protein [Thalassovita gelatinovora]CUH67674.1 DoxX [Thalassovita gelatinovora]SEP69578.1 putative oxidoreductase [Thalassovita gelatinovora]